MALDEPFLLQVRLGLDSHLAATYKQRKLVI